MEHRGGEQEVPLVVPTCLFFRRASPVLGADAVKSRSKVIFLRAVMV